MQMLITYDYLTRHIVPGPQSVSYIVPLVLLPVALLIPRNILSLWKSRLIFLPVMALCTVHAWWKMDGVDVISVDVLLWALFLLVFQDPVQDFRYVKTFVTHDDEQRQQRASDVPVPTGIPELDDDGNITEQSVLVQSDTPSAAYPKDNDDGQSYPTALLERSAWVGTLLVSIRLNNWKICAPSHDKGQPPRPAFASRTSFLLHSIISFARGYIVLDLTRAYIEHDPYFTDPSVPISSSLPFGALWLVPPQLLRSMIIGAQAWALIGQMFYLPCLLPVGLHALGLLADDWSPHNWPPYFGSSKVIFMHGVRGFWGQYWVREEHLQLAYALC
jgi:hypothetical protein